MGKNFFDNSDWKMEAIKAIEKKFVLLGQICGDG